MPSEQPTKREPLLKRYNVRGIEDPYGIWVRYDDIQAKITSGELIQANPRPKLAKATHGIKCASHPTVSIVDSWTAVTDEEWDRLLKEGAQIVTP